jgi:predicted S18 family serine protease
VVRRRFPWIAVLLALVLSGCSEPPQKEIDQAQTAIDGAKSAGADAYAADEYNAAVTALQKAHEAVDQRDYREALSFAIDARQRATGAARQADIAKGHTKAAAEKLVTDCSARASQLDTDLKVAEGARVAPRDLRSARTTLADAETALQETRRAMNAGNYTEVVSSLTEVRRKLDAAIAAVDALRQRPPRRRR